MPGQDAPLRSLLFVPAANSRALEKSGRLDADALIFDLEDSVAPEEKEQARERLRSHLGKLRSRPHGPLIVVRINPLSSEFGTEDLLMARGAWSRAQARPAVDAILLSKVESPADLGVVEEALADTDAPQSLRLWAMIETAKGILKADAIAEAGAGGRLEALVVGPNDIALSTGMRPSPGRPELAPFLAAIVLAASAHGLRAIDGVYNDIADPEGLAAECRSARAMGFCGKTLIHPLQLPAANLAFAPEPDEIVQAKVVVAAFARRDNTGKGVIRIEGRMTERLHLLEAERLLALASAIEATSKRTDP